MKVIKTVIKNTIADLYKAVKMELELEDLNLEAAKDFFQVWKTCVERDIDDLWLKKFELQILEEMQVRWGKGTFLEIDRDKRQIEVWGPMGQKVVLK